MSAMTSATDEELLQRYYSRAAKTDGNCEAALQGANTMVHEVEDHLLTQLMASARGSASGPPHVLTLLRPGP